MSDETSLAELAADLRAMGVAGRDLMVHASYKVIRPVEGGPRGVVDAFVEAVGEGVLLFPAFDFESWSERGYWDRQKSPSKMGAISEEARLDYRSRRSSHPMLSFAVFDPKHGKPSALPRSGVSPYLEESMFGFHEPIAGHGAGSVFDRLVENDGLLLSFSGEGFRKNDVGFTMSNHCAVLADAPWRFMKVFEGVYVDGGVVTIRKYAASVCRRDKYITEVTPAHEAAEREGIITRHKLGRTECLVASARSFVEWGIEAHRERPELWRRSI